MLYRPPVGYSFLVNFLPTLNAKSIAVAAALNGFDYSFKEVTGLNVDLSTTPYREGGANDIVHNLPSAPQYSNVTLRRALLVNSGLGIWVQNSIENFDIVPMDMLITLLGPGGMPLIAWGLVSAYPVKSEISGFNAMQNEIVIESIELACQKHRRIPLPNLPSFS